MAETTRVKKGAFADKLDMAVGVGDYIVYACQPLDSAELRFGRVVSIEYVIDKYDRKRWAIGVHGAATKLCRNEETGELTDEWYAQNRGTLQYPDRIIGINKHDLPEGVRLALEEIEIPATD